MCELFEVIHPELMRDSSLAWIEPNEAFPLPCGVLLGYEVDSVDDRYETTFWAFRPGDKQHRHALLRDGEVLNLHDFAQIIVIPTAVKRDAIGRPLRYLVQLTPEYRIRAEAVRHG